jgi:flagellar biosynthesis protein FlhG
MPDQADILRHLVADALRGQHAAAGPAPPMFAIAGAREDVGATTIAVNLAVALARQGQRVVLVDANFMRPDIAMLCGLKSRYTTADVLGGRREIHEVLLGGPLGVQVLPGAQATPLSVQHSAAGQRKLLAQLARLGQHADLILLDIGSDTSDSAWPYWQAADGVLLVTTSDANSIIDAYAAIKLAAANVQSPRVEVVVNQCVTDETSISEICSALGEAVDVHHRIDDSCQRFLGFSIAMAGGVPLDHDFTIAAQRRVPLVAVAPESIGARAIDQLATTLATTIVPT